MPDPTPCRCGHTTGPHPCHRCGIAPGTSRFYAPSERYSLAGAQMKASVRQTFACAACWLAFTDERNSGGLRDSRRFHLITAAESV